MIRTLILTTAVFVFLAVAGVIAAPSQPSFPKDYHAAFSQMTASSAGQNFTFTDGSLIISSSLEATFQTGLMFGLEVSSLNLYKQKFTFSWAAAGPCRRTPLDTPFSDPLSLIQYTTYKGLEVVNGRQTQKWTFEYGTLLVQVFVTNNSSQEPVRYVVNNQGTGILIDFTSFAAGASASVFVPPRSCASSVVAHLGARSQHHNVDAFAAVNAVVESAIASLQA